MDAKIRPMIGRPARDLVAGHLAAGSLCAIVTATNSFVTGPIAREFGVAHLIATEPEARDGAFTGKVAGVPSFRAGKVTRLEQWLSATGRRLERFDATWFYSDSHNDLPLLELVERPVAVDPDDRLRDLAATRGWPIISLRA
jgi:HAD superfamily hydrolase (TIGR01490 family)